MNKDRLKEMTCDDCGAMGVPTHKFTESEGEYRYLCYFCAESDEGRDAVVTKRILSQMLHSLVATLAEKA